MINKIRNISPISQRPVLRYKAIFGAVLIVVIFFLYTGFTKIKPSNIPASVPPSTQTDSPKILSVKPGSPETEILLQNQPIEITFNKPVENSGEFKHDINPKFKYHLEISSDRKTIKIAPEELYQVGTEYTLIIRQETKFDGGQRMDHEQIYHFKTIQYRGV